MEKIKPLENNENLSDPRPFIMAVIGEIPPLRENDYKIFRLYKIIEEFEVTKLQLLKLIAKQQ